MTRNDTRLGRLSSDLTAQERAVLVLRSWKDGEEEDPSWRLRMPTDQTYEFNKLIALMNEANIELKPLIIVLHLEVEKLQLRLGWLSTLVLWNVQASNVRDYAEFGCKKKVGPYLLSCLEHAPLLPVVYVDEELQSYVEELKAERPPTRIDEFVVMLKDDLHDGVLDQERWLAALDTVLAEVRQEFGGEEPLIPKVQHVLDCVRGELEKVRSEAERFLGPLAAAEPDEELAAKVRAMVGL